MLRRFTIILAMLLASSCVDTIVMDPMEEMPVVVNCVLIRPRIGFAAPADQPMMQYLDLFYAKRPKEDKVTPITDATIAISGGGKSSSFTWNGERWECDLNPEFGVEYKLYVKLRDGRELRATTKFPTDLWIGVFPVYAGISFVSCARYYTLAPLGGGDVYVWITAKEGREYDTHDFCTDHPGADDSNIIDKSCLDLKMADQVIGDFVRLKKEGFVGGTMNQSHAYQYLQTAYNMPLHHGWLRIRHTAGSSFGATEKNVQWVMETMPFTNGFILGTDTIDCDNMSLTGGPAIYSLPVRLYSVSEEYDRYLAETAKTALRRDELITQYSNEGHYSNIEGGLGIFGAAHYRDGL